jgi:hypothetical protein
MPKAYLYRSGFAFFPTSNADTEVMYQFAEGEVFSCEVKKARNYKNHKRFFAMLKLGFENQNDFESEGWFREWVLIKSGNFESCESPTGVMYRAKSISFASMDEIEFRELYRSVSQVIIDLCGITQKQLEKNLNLFT